MYQKSRLCSRAWFAYTEKCTLSTQLLFARAEEFYGCDDTSYLPLENFTSLL